ncbi:hypothetical protein HMPREF1868_01342 [Olsenella sp. DNF00959]|nr:hypothetical protein HMPREF1868_01342 [Olsenella sp. DNF00959]
MKDKRRFCIHICSTINKLHIFVNLNVASQRKTDRTTAKK